MSFYFRHKVNSSATGIPVATAAASVSTSRHLMEFDTTSLLLASAVLAVTYLAVNKPEPDVHPFILNDQSTPANVRRPGESAVYRSKIVPHGSPLPTFPNANTRTITDVFARGYERTANGQHRFLGGKTADGDWSWVSQAKERIRNFGAGLLTLTDLKPGIEDKLGIYMRNSSEWILADLAAAHHSLVTVPMYTAWNLDAVRQCIQQTKLTTLVTTHRELPAMLSICPESSEENSDRAQRLGITLETFSAVENIGATNPCDELPTPKPDDLACICFTCGTSGEPRGVMLTHANQVCSMSSLLSIFMSGKGPNINDVYMSYLPLSHVFEHTLLLAVISVGGQVAAHSQSPHLMEKSAQIVKPTILPLVPHILNRIRDAIEQKVKQSGQLQQILYRRAFAAKLQWLRAGRVVNDSWWDRLVFSKLRAKFGGNVRIVPCGAAPISTDTLDWARVFFGCPVIEGYGQTETCAAISATHPNDYQHPYGSSVGMILPVNEVKLVDVPELCYLASDVPNPRGEICVRGGSVTKGYYGLPEDTRAVLSEDGWLKTGDIGEMLPNGTLKVIDRKKNVSKLSQGEYVAPAKMESIYENCDVVSQTYVHVDPLQHYLVGIVVPDESRLREIARERLQDANAPFSELCHNENVCSAVLEAMHDKGCEHELSRYEQVRRIILHPEPFTVENRLLTPTFK
ncbi:hypothetical protein BDF19DRAFT_433529 [Syncephalis fuscata]|nr:hypothetical protein BDF19DRAFT_433529 [Syncephalis fuscata]